MPEEDQNLGATVDAALSEEVATSPKRGAGGKFVSASDAPVASSNCSGELVELPDEPGTTYHSYECQVCHQVLHVGLEDLAENGLPPEHAPLPVPA